MAKVVTVMGREEWLTPEKVMKEIGKSERSVQRLAAAGHLRWKLESGKRVYHADDLTRIKEEGIPARRVEPETRVLAPRVSAPLALVSVAREVARIFASPRPVDITQKLWLSLEEAAYYSGLAKRDLLTLCQAGKIVSRKSAGWKIRRASLEAFKG
jgi:hypothetical protein